MSEHPAGSMSSHPAGAVSEQLAGSSMAAILKVSPLPKCEKPRVRKRAAESSQHLTGTPYKKKLLEKTENCKQKHGKNSGKVQKVLNLSISSGNETKQKQTSKRKEKLTCREDKPRGRPSSTKAVQKSKSATENKDRRHYGEKGSQ